MCSNICACFRTGRQSLCAIPGLLYLFAVFCALAASAQAQQETPQARAAIQGGEMSAKVLEPGARVELVSSNCLQASAKNLQITVNNSDYQRISD